MTPGRGPKQRATMAVPIESRKRGRSRFATARVRRALATEAARTAKETVEIDGSEDVSFFLLPFIT